MIITFLLCRQTEHMKWHLCNTRGKARVPFLWDLYSRQVCLWSPKTRILFNDVRHLNLMRLVLSFITRISVRRSSTYESPRQVLRLTFYHHQAAFNSKWVREPDYESPACLGLSQRNWPETSALKRLNRREIGILIAHSKTRSFENKISV